MSRKSVFSKLHNLGEFTDPKNYICIFNNLKKFERITEVEEEKKAADVKGETESPKETKNNKESPTWESYGIEDGKGKHKENQSIPYDKKIPGEKRSQGANGDGGKPVTEEMFWQCDAEGLRLADQNEREIKEQYRKIIEGQERKERAQERKAEAEKMKEKIKRDNKALEEADEKGELTERAAGREKTKKEYLKKPPPDAPASSNNSASAMSNIQDAALLSKMLNKQP